MNDLRHLLGFRTWYKNPLAAMAAVVALSLALTLVGCSNPAGQSSQAKDEFASSAADAIEPSDGSIAAKSAIDAEIERKMASMTLEQKVAQLFIVQPGTLDEIGEEGVDAIGDYPVGGFLYMDGNVEGPEQIRAALAEAQQRSHDAIGLPMFLCVDEEGGTVARVAGNPDFGIEDVGDMQAIGAAGDVGAARDAACYIGSYLADLGFNVDFAPVADLAEGNDSMAARSFGTDPDVTSDMVKAQVEGFAQAGMLCALKHFPGIGGIEEDSHDTGIFSDLTADGFRETALKPFAAGIQAKAPFVMAGHLSTPAATGDDVPSSVSRAWLTGVLRDDMGFDGIVVTDSLGMAAVYERYSQYELGVLALQAGADMLLNPADFLDMRQGILDAVARGDLTEDRIDESVERILRVKYSL